MLAAKAAAHFDASSFLLLVACVLFVLACPHRYFQSAKPWFLPLGLAFFAASFFVTIFID